MSTKQESQTKITGDLSAKLFGIGTSLQVDIKDIDSDTEVATQLVRSIQEKALHDYAFDKIVEYMEANDLINNIDPSIGNVVLISEIPTFLDFKYFQTLFSENGAVKLGNEQNKKQIDSLTQALPKGKSIPDHIKQQIHEIKSTYSSSELQRKDVFQNIEFIRNTIPYNRFIMTENFLVPITDKYLRDDPDVIAFKYGGQMSFLGYVTNVIDNTKQSSYNNDFAPLYDSVNTIMLSMFKKEKIYIIHLIALYY